MIFFIIFLLIFLILFILYENIKNYYTKKITDLSFWSGKYGKHHLEMIEFIKEIKFYLDKYKITYWIHAGTLLGAVRHEGFIPWDDDIDFGYIDKENNVNYLIDELKKNYQIDNYFWGWKIISKKNNKIFVDMFEFTIKDNLVKQTILSELLWPKENYYIDELFPLKNSKFESITLPLPAKPELFCKRAFGDNYKEVFYIHSPHYDMFFDNIIDGIGLSLNNGKKFKISDLHQ
jgi:phosphorylcholine metabolism protein LicD